MHTGLDSLIKMWYMGHPWHWQELCEGLGVGVQGGVQGLDMGKLLGGAEPLKEEEDMWFRQQNRSTAVPVCQPTASAVLLIRSLLQYMLQPAETTWHLLSVLHVWPCTVVLVSCNGL